MRTVAAAGPLAVFIAAPIIGWLAGSNGSDGVFWFLTLIALPPAFLRAEFANYRFERRRMTARRRCTSAPKAAS